MLKGLVLLFLFIAQPIRAQTAFIQDEKFGRVWIKPEHPASFTRTDQERNLQEYFTKFYSGHGDLDSGFKALVLLTLIIDGEGFANLSKATASNPAVSLETLQIAKSIHEMPRWFPAEERDKKVPFQVLLSLQFEGNKVLTRYLKF
ncbi:MAG TPA: hypothetical protein PKM27_15640 [Saprospiraceae bacterium]|nr:hypothetical protein [Saprospiraceae bacterium]HNT21257.1 hypothetical protein [Saprospiraceae bacterium]